MDVNHAQAAACLWYRGDVITGVVSIRLQLALCRLDLGYQVAERLHLGEFLQYIKDKTKLNPALRVAAGNLNLAKWMSSCRKQVQVVTREGNVAITGMLQRYR